MINRRQLIAALVAEVGLLGREPVETHVTLRKLRADDQSVLWMAGPPGIRLQKYVGELALCCCGSDAWQAEEYRGDPHGWYRAWMMAPVRPVVFDDAWMRQDIWGTPPEQKLIQIGRWVNVVVTIEGAA